MTALAAGLVFAKFSRPTARIVVSSDSATIAPEDGVDTLAIRIGNERGNAIVDAVFRVALVRTEKSSEGKVFYRSRDSSSCAASAPCRCRARGTSCIPSTRRAPSSARRPVCSPRRSPSCTCSSSASTTSPCRPSTPFTTTTRRSILLGRRHADVLSEDEDGNVTLDLGKFHETEPAGLRARCRQSCSQPSGGRTGAAYGAAGHRKAKRPAPRVGRRAFGTLPCSINPSRTSGRPACPVSPSADETASALP